MELSAVDRFDQATKRYEDTKKEMVQRLADVKEEAILAEDKAIEFVKSLPQQGITIIRALSGNYYVSNGNNLQRATNVIISAEDTEVVEP